MRAVLRQRLRPAVAALALAGGPVLAAGVGPVDLQLAHERSTGRYGEPGRTVIDQTTLVARVQWTRWQFEAQLPWLQVRSADGAGGLPDVGAGATATVQGWGDAWLRAAVTLRDADATRPGLDLALRWKAASGDFGRGLGSGGRDLALQLEWLQPLGAASLFGHLGWRRTGDVPGLRPYRDPWYGELGVQQALDPAWDVGALASVREPLGRLGAQADATLFAAWHRGAQRWQLHLSHGWRDASADWAGGLTWRQRF